MGVRSAHCGSTSDFPSGSESKLDVYAWFADNSGGRTHPVASRRPNAWGIHGLYGNVSEWCEDVLPSRLLRRKSL